MKENKVYTVLKNTSLAIATGLFTGGVVSSAITMGHSKDILLRLFLPALIFYELYITLTVFEKKKSEFLFVINLILGFLFYIYMLIW